MFTTIAPSRMAAKNATGYSGQFGSRMPIRSFFRMPKACRLAASRSALSFISPNVIVRPSYNVAGRCRNCRAAVCRMK
jgi:hypothetical protein